MNLFNLHFSAPLLLSLGLCAIPILLAGLAAKNTGSRTQLLTCSILRMLCILMFTIALAHPAIVKRESRTAIIFAIDRSDSILNGATPQQQIDSATAAMKSKLTKRDLAGLIYFGSDAKIVSPVTRPDYLASGDSQVESDATDIAQALRTAALMFPSGYSKKVVLLSDGQETTGEAQAEAIRLAASGVVIDTVSIGGPGGDEVAVRSVNVPERVKSEETYEVNTIIESTSEQSAIVSILRNGTPISRQRIELKTGINSLYIHEAVENDGPVVYEATVEADNDKIRENNRADALVTVVGRPKVLILGETVEEARSLTATLERQGINSQFASPASAPRDLGSLNTYDAVILNNLSAIHFSDAYLDLLRSYVEDMGGGLFAIGGPSSFGMGGYRNTPLEKVLPVSMDLRNKLKFPAMSLVIIVDRSGSMAGEGQRASKLDLAKEATMSVIDLLPEEAEVGVLTFDSEYDWTIPLAEARDKDAIADKLSAIQTGGGTLLYPPLKSAFEKLSTSNAVIKHVIVITDGRSEPGPFNEVTTEMAAAGITVSTVAIGDDSDRSLLEAMARVGGGRSYYTDDIFTIPRIFVTEAFMASRSLLVDRRFMPLVKAREPILKGVNTSTIPPLLGHLLSVTKPGAIVHLESDDGDPILASWKTGLGRSVAFLADAGTRWAKEWIDWHEAPKFWAGVVRWVMRSWAESPLVVTASVRQQHLVLSVDAIDDNGNYIDFLELNAKVARAGDKTLEVPLEQTGPGKYEASVPINKPSSLLAVIHDVHNKLAPQTASASLPYPDELKIEPIDSAFLGRIAQVTGGSQTTPLKFEPRSGLSPVTTLEPLWVLFTLAGLLFMLMDLLVRSLPENVWIALTSPRQYGKAIGSSIKEAVIRQASEPLRYEEMIWQAKAGVQEKAVNKRYLSEDSPTRSAALYLARLKRERRQKEDEDND